MSYTKERRNSFFFLEFFYFLCSLAYEIRASTKNSIPKTNIPFISVVSNVPVPAIVDAPSTAWICDGAGFAFPGVLPLLLLLLVPPPLVVFGVLVGVIVGLIQEAGFATHGSIVGVGVTLITSVGVALGVAMTEVGPIVGVVQL